MTHQNDEEVNELGRRLAAAYGSCVLKCSSIDDVLERTPAHLGQFWVDLASLLLAAQVVEELAFTPSNVITKYIQ